MPLAMERNCSNTSRIVYTQTWTSAPGAWVGHGKYCLSNLTPSALTLWLLVPRCTLGSAPFCPFLLRIFSFWRTEHLFPCPSLSERRFHLWLKDSGGMFPSPPWACNLFSDDTVRYCWLLNAFQGKHELKTRAASAWNRTPVKPGVGLACSRFYSEKLLRGSKNKWNSAGPSFLRDAREDATRIFSLYFKCF